MCGSWQQFGLQRPHVHRSMAAGKVLLVFLSSLLFQARRVASGDEPKWKKYDCTEWCKRDFQRFGITLEQDQFCTGKEKVGQPSSRCLPAWFQSDDDAEKFFADHLEVEALTTYDTLISFGARGARPSGFSRAQALAKDLEKKGLKPYIDANVLPTLHGAYRLRQHAHVLTMSRHVKWKEYYQGLITQVNRMVFLIDKEWLKSKNCHEELDWVVEGFNTGPAKTIQVVWIGMNMKARSKKEGGLDWVTTKEMNEIARSPGVPEYALDAVGYIKPTPRAVREVLTCSFHGSEVTLNMEEGRQRWNLGSWSVQAQSKHYLQFTLDAHLSPKGMQQEEERQLRLQAANTTRAGVQALWARIQDLWNSPSPPPAYESWEDEEEDHEEDDQDSETCAQASCVTTSAKKKPRPTKPGKGRKGRAGMNKTSCKRCDVRRGNGQQDRRRPDKSPSKGKQLKGTSPRKQRSIKGPQKKKKKNVAQKRWAMKFISMMSFDVCQKKPRPLPLLSWKGESCSDFDSFKVYNYSCGFAGRYCAKDQCLNFRGLTLKSLILKP